MKVRCNNCEKVFDEEEIDKLVNINRLKLSNPDFNEEQCPSCGKSDGLMDLNEQEEKENKI